MEIVGRIKDKGTAKRYQVILSEIEIDKITGIADKPHTTGRYLPGMTINISKIYNKVKRIAENFVVIKQRMAELKIKAQEVEDNLPLLE